MGALLISANWKRADQSDTWGFRDAWAAVLSQVEPHSIFVGDMDTPLFVSYYLQSVEGKAKNLAIISLPSLWDPWYYDSLPDQEMRDVVKTSYDQVTAEYGMGDPHSREYWDGSAKLAHLIAQRYRGRRTVYALHGPVSAFPDPPYFVGVTDVFYRLDFALPPPEVKPAAGSPLVTFPGGAKLVSLQVTPENPRAGQLVDWKARWQLDQTLPVLWFSLRLRPADRSPLRANWKQWEAKGVYEQGFAALCGLWGCCNPTPPGLAYEQRGKFIVPTNAPPGDYQLDVGYGTTCNPIIYDHWVPLGTQVALHVQPAPRPTNGP